VSGPLDTDARPSSGPDHAGSIPNSAPIAAAEAGGLPAGATPVPPDAGGASDASDASGASRRWRRRQGGAPMPFLEHVEELRGVFIDSLWAILVTSVIGWFASDPALALMIRPVGELVFLGPGDALGLKMKVALVLGFVLAAPVILWKIWGFIAPGLLDRERRVIGPLVLSSSVLFFAGIWFALGVLAPITMRFLLSFQTESLRPLLTANAYFDFLAKMSISFGIVFQLPIVVGALSWAGVIPPDLLVRRWREAVVLVFVIAAVFTPPDVVSQMLMAAPLLVLYAISIGVAHALGRGRRARRAPGRAEGRA